MTGNSGISFNLGTFEREGHMQKYYIFLNLGPAAGPAQANITDVQLPIIETRAEVLLGLAGANGQNTRSQSMGQMKINLDIAFKLTKGEDLGKDDNADEMRAKQTHSPPAELHRAKSKI